eukprot:symbB.v1.2.026788.t2/scaffold2527.1/size76866/2
MIADCQSALARTLELEANVPCGFVTCQPMLSARSISSLVGRAQLHDFNRPRGSSFPKAATSKRLPYTWNLLGAWQHLGILAFSFRRVCFSNMTKRAKPNPTSFTSWTCSLLKCKEPICDSDARVEVAISLKGEATSDSIDTLVNWKDGTTMAFHKSCWESLLQERASLSGTELQRMQQVAATAEHFDSFDDLKQKAQQAANILQQSSRPICFTGAGLSTAAGLGDYRGKRGKWTLEGQGVDEAYTTVYEELRPTFAHEAVAKLVEMGKIRYVISQNADGLHHLSGIPYTNLSDVHGSAFTEYCPSCGKRYVRQTYAPEDRAEDFFAGRLPGPIPSHIKRCLFMIQSSALEMVWKNVHAAEADACLSLGSTMSIGPSNQVVLIQKGPLLVCVRQDTEMDQRCVATGGVRAYGDCDAFMYHLMVEMLGKGFSEWQASLTQKKYSYDALRPAAGKKRGDIFVKKF